MPDPFFTTEMITYNYVLIGGSSEVGFAAVFIDRDSLDEDSVGPVLQDFLKGLSSIQPNTLSECQFHLIGGVRSSPAVESAEKPLIEIENALQENGIRPSQIKTLAVGASETFGRTSRRQWFPLFDCRKGVMYEATTYDENTNYYRISGKELTSWASGKEPGWEPIFGLALSQRLDSIRKLTGPEAKELLLSVSRETTVLLYGSMATSGYLRTGEPTDFDIFARPQDTQSVIKVLESFAIKHPEAKLTAWTIDGSQREVDLNSPLATIFTVKIGEKTIADIYCGQRNDNKIQSNLADAYWHSIWQTGTANVDSIALEVNWESLFLGGDPPLESLTTLVLPSTLRTDFQDSFVTIKGNQPVGDDQFDKFPEKFARLIYLYFSVTSALTARPWANLANNIDQTITKWTVHLKNQPTPLAKEQAQDVARYLIKAARTVHTDQVKPIREQLKRWQIDQVLDKITPNLDPSTIKTLTDTIG